MRSFVSRHQIGLFFVLAYLLSWWSAPLTGGQLIPYGPALAALIVVSVVPGRQGLAQLWCQVTRWRVSWLWYLIAPLIMAGIHLAAVALNLALGARIASGGPIPSWASFWPLGLELILLGGMWEEPGWSGFALPRLQERWAGRPGAGLSAVLLLGVLRAVWHIPLLLCGYLPWYDLVFFIPSFQVIIAWLYKRSGGSVPVVMLFHLSSNLVFAVSSPLFVGVDQARYHALFVGVAVLVAGVLTLFTGSGPLSQRLVVSPGAGTEPARTV